MRIPFNQIRFPKKDEYVWGVNFTRIIKRKNERAAFAWVPKTEQGLVSRFARLEGIRAIRPGTHFEFLPYAVGQAQVSPSEPGNPFETGRKALGNLGFDLKYGLQSNLTLDATVNPDFGQVEVDPAVVNLTAYETYYEEKRPFFIEGASIFNGFGRGGVYINAAINWPGPQFFYSSERWSSGMLGHWVKKRFRPPESHYSIIPFIHYSATRNAANNRICRRKSRELYAVCRCVG